jgi:hypothetical protein
MEDIGMEEVIAQMPCDATTWLQHALLWCIEKRQYK